LKTQIQRGRAIRRWRSGLPLYAAENVSQEVSNDLFQAHLSVYWFFAQFTQGRRVLDIGCSPAYTQNGRTLFSNDHDYDDAWNELRAQHNQINCALHPHVDSEAARDTGTQLFSRQCTAANVHGVCTASHSVQTHRATFVFRAVNLDGHVRWILLTAYPRQH